MGIIKESIFGSNSIGVYIAINNDFLLVPKNADQEKINSIKKAFPENFPVNYMSLNQSALLGSYIALNSKGILLPTLILESEINQLKSFIKNIGLDLNITEIDSKDNALGNLILCNNKGAVISKELTPNVKIIQESLDVEVLILDYAGNRLPGSAGVTNSSGCCVHPMISDEEAEMISDILKVPVDVSTINMGDPFLRGGTIVNDYGGVFGKDSSGPELMRLTNMLKL
ncbi:MAG: translation initiation factor IF-6 [archaeon]|nr:translation initiation factor IF-6 [archaeon]